MNNRIKWLYIGILNIFGKKYLYGKSDGDQDLNNYMFMTNDYNKYFLYRMSDYAKGYLQKTIRDLKNDR